MVLYNRTSNAGAMYSIVVNLEEGLAVDVFVKTVRCLRPGCTVDGGERVAIQPPPARPVATVGNVGPHRARVVPPLTIVVAHAVVVIAYKVDNAVVGL